MDNFQMIVEVQVFTGFSDNRSLLTFYKQFFNAALNDENLRFRNGEVIRRLEKYMQNDHCKIYYNNCRHKSNSDLETLCRYLAKVFSPKKEFQQTVDVVKSYIRYSKKREKKVSEVLFCLRTAEWKPIKIKETSPLYIRPQPVVKKQPIKRGATPNANSKKAVFSLKADLPTKINKLKLDPEPEIVDPRLQEILAQNYSELKKRLLKNGQLFKDRVFPAEDKSLCSSRPPGKEIKWLRPHEIVTNPLFVSDGISRFDVKQGKLGDCWLLAAIANLTLHKKLIGKVFDPKQSFSEDYCGIFQFRFWHFGEWTEVVVDDRLPTVNGKLIYLHSEDRQEFWSALLEKAYAKLHGSYEAIEGGWTCEALEDMTGGLTEVINTTKYDPRNLFRMMFRGIKMSSLFGCAVDLKATQLESELPAGIFEEHAYSITGISVVNAKKGPTQLIRIRNPWGTGDEWKGKWSDNSKQWNELTDAVKAEIGYTNKHDGEFFMAFKDFLKNFKTLDICHVDAKIMEQFHEIPKESPETWSKKIFHGAWIFQKTAGGSRTNPKSFARNPQYFIRLPGEDCHGGMHTLIVGVLQKYQRERHSNELLSIKFAIFETENVGTEKLDKDYFENKKPFFESNVVFEGSLREITCRLTIPPGEYVIVPFTINRSEEGNFMLRIFADCNFESDELH